MDVRQQRPADGRNGRQHNLLDASVTYVYLSVCIHEIISFVGAAVALDSSHMIA